MKTKKIEKKLKELEEKKKVLIEKLNENKSKTMIVCEGHYLWKDQKGCGKEFKIGDLTYIQTYCYEEPHGCTGGDYWFPSEGQFDCPECGIRNRLHNRKDYQDLKYNFKNIVAAHGKSQTPKIDKVQT